MMTRLLLACALVVLPLAATTASAGGVSCEPAGDGYDCRIAAGEYCEDYSIRVFTDPYFSSCNGYDGPLDLLP